MARNGIDTNWMSNSLKRIGKGTTTVRLRLTPCLEPKYAPMADRGAEIPNHKNTMVNIVPNGTAPDDPAMIRNKSRRKMMMKMRLFDNQSDK